MDPSTQTADNTPDQSNPIVPPHAHNGVDSPLIDSVANTLSISLTGDVTGTGSGSVPATLATVNSNTGTWGSSTQIPSFTVNAKGLITAAANNPFSVSAINVSVLAGEKLVVGEVVFLYKATGSYTVDGYHMVNGTTYAVRAASTNATYGVNVIGIVTTGAVYLGTATVAVAGVATGLSGLDGMSKYYLQDFTATSAAAISQTTWDTEAVLSDNTHNNTWRQTFVPTSSRMDKIVIYAAKNGGVSGEIDIAIKRGNTTIASGSVTGSDTSKTFTERTLDFADVQVYKGELLNIWITNNGYVAAQGGGFYFKYSASGNLYSDTSEGVSTWLENNSVVLSGASLYMKIYEYPGFGQLGTSAGTRKFKIGNALSATSATVQLQELDANL